MKTLTPAQISSRVYQYSIEDQHPDLSAIVRGVKGWMQQIGRCQQTTEVSLAPAAKLCQTYLKESLKQNEVYSMPLRMWDLVLQRHDEETWLDVELGSIIDAMLLEAPGLPIQTS